MNPNYDIKDGGFVEISVYNSCGRKISTLVNSKTHQSGRFTADLSGNLPAGVYYIIMQTGNGNFTQKAVKLNR